MLETPQIARCEYFSPIYEPAITIRSNRMKFNSACLKQFPNTDYVHFAIYPKGKILNVIPVECDIQHGIRWSSYTDKRKPKEISCEEFAKKLYRLMDWDPYNRYRILGKIAADRSGQKIIAFDLAESKTLTRFEQTDDLLSLTTSPEQSDSFGIPEDQLSTHPLIRRFTKDTEIIIGKEIEDATNS